MHYSFNIKEAGNYSIQARVKTSGTHCSNVVSVFLDGRRLGNFGGHPKKTDRKWPIEPFRWKWDCPQKIYLKKGKHDIRVYPWEDGVSIDQIMISKRPMEGNATIDGFTDNLPHGKKSVFLMHDLSTSVISKDKKPEIRVWIRRTRKLKGKKVNIRTVLELKDKSVTLAEAEYSPEEIPDLSSYKLDFSDVDIGKLPMREFLLKTTFTVDGKEQAFATTALIKPLEWRVQGPFPYWRTRETTKLDKWATEDVYKVGGKKYPWRKI